MKSIKGMIWGMMILVLVFSNSCQVINRPSQAPAETSATHPANQVTGNAFDGNAAALIDSDRLYQYLEDLTSIRPNAGWRNSATPGEAQAIQYVSSTLLKMEYLNHLGLKLTQDDFHVFQSTLFRTISLQVQIDGQFVKIPANGLRGSRDSNQSALRLDSDGKLNDILPNPVTVSGKTVVLRSQDQINALSPDSQAGNLLFIDYALVDTVWEPKFVENMRNIVLAKPEGIVLVTSFSNQQGTSHGTYVGDLGAISKLESEPSVPTIYMRIEDMPSQAGDPWQALSNSSQAQMTWDTDVLSPGNSSNLIAYIPGRTHDRAILLSAHIDSANTPGAMDDGSGSAILMEVAAAINQAQIIPELDLYLVWYGSEELGLLGSANFTATHQDILDRLVGMLNIDCLTRPIDGVPATINFAFGSGSSGSADSDPWVNYLVNKAEDNKIDVQRVYLPLASDNSSFAGYNVANLDLIYDSEAMQDRYGGVWFAGHIHDPYDEVKLVREVDAQFQQMAQIALVTALLPADVPEFREKTNEDQRVVFIASHTEDVLMTPAALFDLGLAFENEGLDVDVIPYGTPVSEAALNKAQIVVALPIIDYPSEENSAMYDESWQTAEIEILKNYVNNGGVLVITNSARRLKYYNTIYEPNEDWMKMDALAGIFGAQYQQVNMLPNSTSTITNSPITHEIQSIQWYQNNGLPFTLEKKNVLATASSLPVLGLVKYGKGTAIIMADIGMISAYPNGLLNPVLVQNIIDYAK